jgi:plastocyanin
VVTLKRILSALVVIGAFMYASVALGAPRQIAVDDNVFTPEVPAVQVPAAGNFHWQRASGSIRRHNVHQDKGLFSSGALTSGPINFTISASAGSYHYYCELHGTANPPAGMDGVIKVRPIGNANPTGNPFTVTWALPGSNTGNRFDVRFRRGTTGAFTTWKNDSAARSGIFGQAGAPIPVTPGQTYQFQARSQKTASQQSDWSPVLTFHT